MQRLIEVETTQKFSDRGSVRQPRRKFKVTRETARKWIERNVARLVPGQFATAGPDELKKSFAVPTAFRFVHTPGLTGSGTVTR